MISHTQFQDKIARWQIHVGAKIATKKERIKTHVHNSSEIIILNKTA